MTLAHDEAADLHGRCIPTRYFFAGGRAREPEVKDEAYTSFLETKFFWTGVDMLSMLRGTCG
jgi:hypothetical protein